ncbi:MAG: T9SS type B sorting domain-containing protein [Sphingobacteriales bacterium]|nr:MAG: T9SS type B sorting domain-containing protein [Sphingobacteriales bacterium]
MKYICCILFILGSATFSYAQKEAGVWYFGNRAGIDFTTDTPKAVFGNQMITDEGCATFCDTSGKLLFYTDGIKVWNRFGQIMPNGENLKGDSSATQAAVIVPFQNIPYLYYIFTIDREGKKNGLQYSVLDMSQDYGRGDIIIKNIKLESPVCEKLTAVLHRNRRDMWIISHRWNSRKFVAYLITSNGISPKPVISETGSYHGGDVLRSIGYLKVSPDGRKIASVINAIAGECQVLDFNNETGVISNPFSIKGLKRPYGVEFSPSGTFLYTGNYDFPSQVYQYNLYKGDSNVINKSRILVANIRGGDGIGAYQLGPDRRIYITHYDRSKLSVINYPDYEGKKCDFTLASINLGERNAMMGLPDFVQSYFGVEVKLGFNTNAVCYGEQASFLAFCNVTPLKWEWDFGDPNNANNISAEENPTHFFSKPGIFKVKLYASVAGYDYSLTQDVHVLENPELELGDDGLYCEGDSVILSGGNLPGQHFLWSTKDTSRTISVKKAGKYWVQTTTNHCLRSDTIHISFINTDSFHLNNDTVICELTEYWLKGNVRNAKYLWNNGSTSDSILPKKTGTYTLQMKVGNCVVTDSQHVSILPAPKANIGPDELLCEYDEKTLDAGGNGQEYLWSTGENTRNIIARKYGKYWVKIKTCACESSDTIHLAVCPPQLYAPNVFSPNNDGINDSFVVLGKDIQSSLLIIYNRWGEQLFCTDNIKTGWDGKYNKKTCPPDSYFWVLKYIGKKSGVADYKQLSGTVNLIR